MDKDDSFLFTRYASRDSKSSNPFTFGFKKIHEVTTCLQAHAPDAETKKDALQAIVPGKTAGRCNTDVESLCLLVIDIDNKDEHGQLVEEPIDFDTLTTLLSDYEWAAYTTSSHREDWPRIRLLMMPDEAIEPDECRTILSGLHYLLNNMEGVDTACFNPGRLYYVPKKDADWRINEGAPVPIQFLRSLGAEQEDFLAELNGGKAPSPKRTKRECLGRNDTLKNQVSGGWFNEENAHLSEADLIEKLSAEIWEYDQAKHSPPLFEDPLEHYIRQARGDSRKAAENFTKSNIRSLKRAERERPKAREATRFDKYFEGSSSGYRSGFNTLKEFIEKRRCENKYVVEGIFEFGKLYAMVGEPGAGKTAVSLKIGADVCMGQKSFGRETHKGMVVYLAGENPDDICGRMQGLIAQKTLCDNANMIIWDQVFDIKKDGIEVLSELDEHAEKVGKEYTLIIVDTEGVFMSEEIDENDNVKRRSHARQLRAFTELIGGPAVLALTHPKKGSSGPKMTPRGAGSFLGEIDGLVCLSLSNGAHRLQPHDAKFRGKAFDAVTFELETLEQNGLTTVVVKDDQTTVWKNMLRDADPQKLHRLLDDYKSHPEDRQVDRATRLSWSQSEVSKQLKKLKKHGFVQRGKGTVEITEKGEEFLSLSITEDAQSWIDGGAK